MKSNRNTIIVVTGSTAVGKTSLSISLAKQLNTEIISSDSRQFYTEMSIGSAVPNKDELAAITHHFIHSESIQNPLSAGQFAKKALPLLQDLLAEYNTAIITGGSGLYIDALLYAPNSFPPKDEALKENLTQILEENGLDYLVNMLVLKDPKAHGTIDLSNSRRVIRALEIVMISGKSQLDYTLEINPELNADIYFVILERDRNLLYERINTRVDEMISLGLKEEAQSIYKSLQSSGLDTVGYQEWIPYFQGEYDEQEAIRLIKRNTRRYAKRQITWFKKYKNALHLNLETEAQPNDAIQEFLKKQ